MSDLSRRDTLAGAAAGLASSALPVAAVVSPQSQEQRIRALLLANVEKSAAALAAAIERGEPELQIEHFHRYGHQLDREELRLFDRFQGSWRELFGLPVVYV